MQAAINALLRAVCRGSGAAPSSGALLPTGPLAGLPVAMHFKDLGADQQVGVRRKGRLSADQVRSAAERLRRCVTLAAGFAQRMWVMAAAGLPAALYGIGQEAWPGRLLAGARHGALNAVVRSTAPVALSALVALGLREMRRRWPFPPRMNRASTMPRRRMFRSRLWRSVLCIFLAPTRSSWRASRAGSWRQSRRKCAGNTNEGSFEDV